MKLHLFRYECKNCGKIFKSPELSGNGYGEFLMRSKDGDILYLDSFKDKVFDEMKNFFEEISKKVSKITELNQVKIFQTIFTASCDARSDGSTYSIRQEPRCPYCGKINIGHWGPTNPPEFIEQDLKPVTHERWNKLTDEEKRALVDKAITDYLARGSEWV